MARACTIAMLTVLGAVGWSTAQAQQVCRNFVVTMVNPVSRFEGPLIEPLCQQAAAARAAYNNGVDANFTQEVRVSGFRPPGPYQANDAPGCDWERRLTAKTQVGEQYCQQNPGYCGVWATYIVTTGDDTTVAGECPGPDECDANGVGVGDSLTSSVYPGADGYCHPLTHCKISVKSSLSANGSTIYNWIHTNQNCDSGSQTADEDDFEDETCVTTAGGNEVCISKDGQNCGYFNGQFVCFDRIENDGCAAFGDGSRLCGSQAPVPPVPDNGTRGTAATPDDSVQTSTNNTYNYYNTTTVNNSGRPVNAGGDNPYDGDDGSGTSGPSQEGTSEGLMCDSATDSGCSSGGEGGGPEDDLRSGWDCWAEGAGLAASVQQCFATASRNAYQAIVSDSSLLSVATATASAWPSSGGTCPSGTVDIDWLGASFDFWEVPCTFLDDVESVLGPIFLLCWSLIGLRILLSIPGGE